MYKGLNLSGDDLATIPVRFQSAIAPGFRFNPDSEIGDDSIKSAEGATQPNPEQRPRAAAMAGTNPCPSSRIMQAIVSESCFDALMTCELDAARGNGRYQRLLRINESLWESHPFRF